MNTYDYIFIGAGSAACTLAQGLTGNAAHKVLMLGISNDLIGMKTHEDIPRTEVLNGVPHGGMDLVQYTIGDGKRPRVHMSRDQRD